MPTTLDANELDRWLNEAHKNAAALLRAGQAQKQEREKFLQKTTSEARVDPNTGTLRLTPEQKWAVKFAEAHIKTPADKALQGVIIAHSMGMGKTLIGIKASQAFLEINRATSVTVITTLPVLRDQWQAELTDTSKAGKPTFFVGKHRGAIEFRVAGEEPDRIDVDGKTARKMTDDGEYQMDLHRASPAPRVYADEINVNGKTARKINNDGVYQLDLQCVSQARAVYATLQNMDDVKIKILNNTYHTPDDFFTGFKVDKGDDVTHGDPCLAACDYIIISHDLFKTHRSQLADILDKRRKLLVVDEAQKAKNQTNTNNLHANIKGFPGKRLLLTGTPMEITINDVWSLAELLVPEKPKEGMEKVLKQQVQQNTSEQNTSEKNDTTLLKVDALITKYNDPTKNFQEYSDLLKTKYKQMVYFINTCMFAFMDRVGPGALTAELRQQGVQRFEFCAVCPADPVDENIVEGMLIPSEARKAMLAACINQRKQELCKTIIFYSFNDYYEEIETALIEQCRLEPDTNFKRLYGHIPGTERKELIRQFEENPEIKVLVANIQVGGVGLNLQNSANMIIFVNTDWNPAVVDQAAGRIWRRGQKKNCCILHLLAEKDIGQTGDFRKRNHDDSTQKLTDEYSKFKVMMSRIIANTNFLDGKFLAGDDSDMLQPVTENGTARDWVQFLQTCRTNAMPGRPQDITLKQVEFDLKNIIDVSTPPEELNMFERYRINGPGSLPIYSDMNNETYTEAFITLAESIRTELMAKTYYCDLHRAWFFKGEPSTMPPLFYPLDDTDERMDAVPEKFRLTFRRGLTPKQGNAAWQHTDPCTSFNRENQNWRENCDGIFCLDADMTGAVVDADLKAHAVALLHLLVRSIPEHLPKDEPYWKILLRQTEKHRIRCYPVPAKFFNKTMKDNAQSPMAIAKACLDILFPKKNQTEVHLVDATIPQLSEIPDTTTNVLVCGGYSKNLGDQMEQYGFYATTEDMVRCEAGEGTPLAAMVTREQGRWRLTPGACTFLEGNHASMMDMKVNIVYRMLHRDIDWTKTWTFVCDGKEDVKLELNGMITVKDAVEELKRALTEKKLVEVSQGKTMAVTIESRGNNKPKNSDKLSQYEVGNRVKYQVHITSTTAEWTFKLADGGENQLEVVKLELDKNVTVNVAQARLKKKLQEIGPPYISEDEKATINVKIHTGETKQGGVKLITIAPKYVVQYTLERQEVTWTFKLPNGDDNALKEVMLELDKNVTVTDALAQLKVNLQKTDPLYASTEEEVALDIQTTPDKPKKTGDKLGKFATDYAVGITVKRQRVTWTFRNVLARSDEGSRKAQPDVKLTLKANASIQDAQIELLQYWEKQTPPIVTDDENITVTIRTDQSSRSRDKLNSIFTGSEVLYDLHYNYKTSDTAWTFQNWDDRDQADDIKKQSEVVLTLPRKVNINKAESELRQKFTETALEVNLLDGNGARIPIKSEPLSTIAAGLRVWYQKKSTKITVTWVPYLPAFTADLKNATFDNTQTLEDLYLHLAGVNKDYAWQLQDATRRDLKPNKQKIVKQNFERDGEAYKVYYKYTVKQSFYVKLDSQVDAVNKSALLQRLHSKPNKKIVGVQEKTDTDEIEVTVKENYTHGDLVKAVQGGDAVKVTLLAQDGQPLAAGPTVIANEQHVTVKVEPLQKMHWRVQVVQDHVVHETYDIEEVGDADDVKQVLSRVKRAAQAQYDIDHPGNTTTLSPGSYRKEGDQYVLPMNISMKPPKKVVHVAGGNGSGGSAPTDSVPGDMQPSDPMPL